ncbi:hypothetical protein JOM56_011664 [Amanita muscaria]
MPLLQLYKFNLMSAQDSINLFAMKSFKVLIFLTLAAAFSCGANGSPTNLTTDGYPTKPSQQALKGIMDSLQSIANVYHDQYGDDWASFTKEYSKRLGWFRAYNYVVCRVMYSMQFDGKQGIDWNGGKVKFAPPGDNPKQPWIYYDVLVGGAGTFTRKGRGGYYNWAWSGYTVPNQDMHSKFLTFVAPPGGRLEEGGGD